MNIGIFIPALSRDWFFSNGFALNTNLFETNFINLAIVIGVLVYFGKGVLTNLLENRKGLLLSTIKDAEERYQKALEDFNNARIFLEEAQIKAKEIRENGVLQLSKEKEKLILASEQGYQKLEDYRNSTIALREQNLINDIRQQVSYLALQVTLKTFNDRLNTDLHSRIVDYYIGLFKNMEE